MSALFDGIITPLKVDISTGDAITPHEVCYSFSLMFEERTINIWAYNLETVLAEKMETIIARNTTNTRMRDFYDIHILCNMYADSLNADCLREAVVTTSEKRGSAELLQYADEALDEVEQSAVMQKLWSEYCRKFSYADGIAWREVMASVRRIFLMCELL